ncbi:TIGR03503 family protein [Vibrio sp.]|uniref:TIGR03503 family protein n=1 Tax=Vibrio sp. TaxID=678 RepID=UPI003D122EDB
MARIVALWLGLCWATITFASQESALSLLDNRFRVDPSISQITFLIYRAERSQPVVLVRPDGKKYYVNRSPDNVRWYQEPSMDIISVDKPMPGPWQAIGKVTPKNKIKLISHLELSTDSLPSRLYQGEELKFTARLTSDGKPLVLRDFLDRVKLKVTFTKYIENEKALIKEARPVANVLGEFADDGRGLDEQAGDGVFTVALPISAKPDKYRVRITSGNGVFLRAQEQTVLVYPTPIQHTFIQSRKQGEPHQVVLSGEQGMVKPDSVVAHVAHNNPDGSQNLVEGVSDPATGKVTMSIPYSGVLGNYSWQGVMYADDVATGRSLSFPISQQTYSVVEDIDIAETRRLQQEREQQLAKVRQQQQILQMREEKRTRNIIIIAVGNLLALLLGAAVWIVLRKRRAQQQAMPEMQLEMPKQ